ncbi:MAG: hypothetical protein WBY88_05650 [Desulfosarcina sp.]
MRIHQRLVNETKALVIAAIYFGCWIAGLLLVKYLVLAEYQIAFTGWTMVLVGALILSKVVLVLEHVSLGAWVHAQPAWVEVLLRTILYSLGVALVLIIEKGIENRHAYGGFVQALQQLVHHENAHHVWANTVCISGALLGYNMLSVIQRQLGKGTLKRIFFSSLAKETEVDR